MEFREIHWARLAPWLLLACAWLLQWPLVANPGYFSHDELQWAAFASAPEGFAWVSWLDVDAFQYRPLTFNLWLVLSGALFDAPHAFHALLVAWGAGNATLLFLLARRWSVAMAPAFAASLVFALSAYATYVHGWVGTLADLAWVSCALLAGLLASSRARIWQVAVGTALLTLAALLAKEAAVVIPAVLAVAWACVGLRHARASRLLGAAIASGVPVAAYLALRLGVLLSSAQAPTYQIDPWALPRHWLEYQLFPFLPNVFEVFNTLAFGLHVGLFLAALLWLGIVAACWRTGWRLAAFFLLGGVATLAPVLPIFASSNQYAYGYAALATATVAAAWPQRMDWRRIAIGLGALAWLVHGVFVMGSMRHVGEVQAVFSSALADALRSRGDAPLRLRTSAEADAERWIFIRLTHQIPRYRGVPIGDRVELVDDTAPADGVITRDGAIRPL